MITLRQPHFSIDPPPRLGRSGASSAREMALKVEGVVNGGVHAEEALGGSSRLEPLQLALASSHRLMRVLRAIVRPQPLLVRAGQAQTAEDRGLSVISNLGAKPCFLSSLRISRSAARLSRRRWTQFIHRTPRSHSRV